MNPWLAATGLWLVGNGLDCWSSLGQMELNPLMRRSYGRFSLPRAVALKLVSLTYLVSTGLPWLVGAVGALAGLIAARNWRVRGRASRNAARAPDYVGG